MKRGREEEDAQITLDLVSSLMQLSKVGQNDSPLVKKQKTTSDHAFVCKTCKREFPSFQALGGHRASHNKQKLIAENNGHIIDLVLHLEQSSPAKAKTHECPICGVEFAIGQALGGHMRRHRDVMSSRTGDWGQEAAVVPVLKRLNSRKRVSCLNLDLNLAPPGEQRCYDLTKLQLIV